MPPRVAGPEPTIVMRVFPAWSIEVPATFDETFVEEHAYWHPFDPVRSISLTSIRLSDDRGPVCAEDIVRETRGVTGEMQGDAIADRPDGLPGWAYTANAEPGARASRLLSGGLAIDGCLLIVTITAGDLDWARGAWLSIRTHRPYAAGH